MKQKKPIKKSNSALMKELEQLNYRAAFYANIMRHLMVKSNISILQISQPEYLKWESGDVTIKHRFNPEVNSLEVMSEFEEYKK